MHSLQVNKESRFQPVPTACSLLNVSRATLMRLAGECDAVLRFNKSVRIDTQKLIAHIEANYSGK